MEKWTSATGDQYAVPNKLRRHLEDPGHGESKKNKTKQNKTKNKTKQKETTNLNGWTALE